MKIINKKRFILSMTVILLFMITFCKFIGSKVFSYTEPTYTHITVSEGDTLWQIAQKGSGNIDKTIYEIKKLNHLSTSCIYVGQELVVPFVYE